MKNIAGTAAGDRIKRGGNERVGRRALYTARRTEHTRTYTHIHTRQLKTCQLGNAVPVAQPETTIRHVAEQRGRKYCHCVCYFCLCVCVLSSCVGWGGFTLRPRCTASRRGCWGQRKDKTRLLHVISSLCICITLS